jgi:thiosulfate dehydrogenase (quinone) large subunit
VCRAAPVDPTGGEHPGGVVTKQTEHLEQPTDTGSSGPAPGRVRALRAVTVALRLSVGWIFLWAFVDKLFGLGHETTSGQAWIHGGHPTRGFLTKAATGPLKSFYNDLAGTWADWLFMIGLLGIGVAVTAGVAMRIAAASGALLLVLMWSAVLPPANNPFMDDHLVDAMVLVALALMGAGKIFGLGEAWERLPIVARFAVLR